VLDSTDDEEFRQEWFGWLANVKKRLAELRLVIGSKPSERLPVEEPMDKFRFTCCLLIECEERGIAAGRTINLSDLSADDHRLRDKALVVGESHERRIRLRLAEPSDVAELERLNQAASRAASELLWPNRVPGDYGPSLFSLN
jgi:hypothetical protein